MKQRNELKKLVSFFSCLCPCCAVVWPPSPATTAPGNPYECGQSCHAARGSGAQLAPRLPGFKRKLDYIVKILRSQLHALGDPTRGGQTR